MNVLVLGAGGIGGYFGGRLASAGVDVSFLVRPARAKLLSRNGLTISSPLGDVKEQVRILTEADMAYDAVLLACKAYDLDAAIEAISPAVGPSTLLVPLLNGVRHLERLDSCFGREHVLGGLCHIGVTVSDAGEIQHLNKLERFVFGARTEDQSESAEALYRVLARGGFHPVMSETILQEMWEKFVFLATYAGMTTLMRAPVGAIVATQEGEAVIREMLEECTATAAASGYAPRAEAMRSMVGSLTERGSKGTASMYRDMVNNKRTEHEHILGDMLERARAASVSAPLLRISLTNMQAYDQERAVS
ncbi:2-dehydropantoate 2-reductase [Methyloligella solikamskensis]|uniref:2-dehydropantoate 2-reductase n=1 Tax=Methyloligella solikamskensis TaxID=1177756 RepID=A0ABW3J9K4_9HYPH